MLDALAEHPRVPIILGTVIAFAMMALLILVEREKKSRVDGRRNDELGPGLAIGIPEIEFQTDQARQSPGVPPFVAPTRRLVFVAAPGHVFRALGRTPATAPEICSPCCAAPRRSRTSSPGT